MKQPFNKVYFVDYTIREIGSIVSTTDIILSDEYITNMSDAVSTIKDTLTSDTSRVVIILNNINFLHELKE